MGEARRRASQGLPPRQKKTDPKDSEPGDDEYFNGQTG